jgi:hypothetical protein
LVLNNSKKIRKQINGGYTVKEWRQIEDKVVADISDEVLEFVQINILKNALKKKGRKGNRLLRNYTTSGSEGFLNWQPLWWTKGCNTTL